MYGQENLIHELCFIQRAEHCIAKYVIESGALYTKSIWRLISDGRCSSPLSSSILPLLPPPTPPGHYQPLQYHQLWIQMIKIICKMKFFFERRPVNTVWIIYKNCCNALRSCSCNKGSSFAKNFFAAPDRSPFKRTTCPDDPNSLQKVCCNGLGLVYLVRIRPSSLQNDSFFGWFVKVFQHQCFFSGFTPFYLFPSKPAIKRLISLLPWKEVFPVFLFFPSRFIQLWEN